MTQLRPGTLCEIIHPVTGEVTEAHFVGPLLTLWGDGLHDDTAAHQALIYGFFVQRPDGTIVRSIGIHADDVPWR